MWGILTVVRRALLIPKADSSVQTFPSLASLGLCPGTARPAPPVKAGIVSQVLVVANLFSFLLLLSLYVG